MSPRPPLNPGATRGADLVRSKLGDGSLHAGDHLPPIAELAAEAGIPCTAMWQATTRLREEGVLVKRGRALIIAPATDADDLQETPAGGDRRRNARWSDCARRIERDLLAGRFGDGAALPMAKVLAGLYNVNYRTLRKATAFLSERGILSGRKGITTATHPSRGSRVIVLSHGWGAGRLDFGYLHPVFLPLLESLGGQFGVRIDTCIFDDDGGRLRYARPLAGATDPFTDTGDVLGYLYPLVSPMNLSDEVLRELSLTQPRTAIIDGVGRGGFPAFPYDSQRRRVFVLPSAYRGPQEVARYLLSRGHRRAAYVSPYHGTEWSRARCTALAGEFRTAGPEAAVVPFVLDFSDIQEFGGPRRLFESRQFIDNCMAAFNRRGSALPATYHERIGEHFSGVLPWRFLYSEVACALEPLFDRALEDRSMTVWIASHDETAVMMLDYLRKRGVEVPGRLSVISFDNFHDAVHRRLTSYDFNLRGVLHAALTFLVHIGDFSDIRKKRVIELPGMLIERESVRPL